MPATSSPTTPASRLPPPPNPPRLRCSAQVLPVSRPRAGSARRPEQAIVPRTKAAENFSPPFSCPGGLLSPLRNAQSRSRNQEKPDVRLCHLHAREDQRPRRTRPLPRKGRCRPRGPQPEGARPLQQGGVAGRCAGGRRGDPRIPHLRRSQGLVRQRRLQSRPQTPFPGGGLPRADRGGRVDGANLCQTACLSDPGVVMFKHVFPSIFALAFCATAALAADPAPTMPADAGEAAFVTELQTA